jgi:hypothetical protein
MPLNHRILNPVPPAAGRPLRRIAAPLIVHTPPSASTICAAGGTSVPSGDSGGRTVTTDVVVLDPPELAR